MVSCVSLCIALMCLHLKGMSGVLNFVQMGCDSLERSVMGVALRVDWMCLHLEGLSGVEFCRVSMCLHSS